MHSRPEDFDSCSPPSETATPQKTLQYNASPILYLFQTYSKHLFQRVYNSYKPLSPLCCSYPLNNPIHPRKSLLTHLYPQINTYSPHSQLYWTQKKTREMFMVGIIYTISYVCRASEADFQTTPRHRLTIFCTLFELFGCTGAAAWAVFAAGIQQSPPRHSHTPRAPPVEFSRAPPVA